MNCGNAVDNKTLADALAMTLGGPVNASGPLNIESAARMAHTHL